MEDAAAPEFDSIGRPRRAPPEVGVTRGRVASVAVLAFFVASRVTGIGCCRIVRLDGARWDQPVGQTGLARCFYRQVGWVAGRRTNGFAPAGKR